MFDSTVVLRQAVDHRAGHLGLQRVVLIHPHGVFFVQNHHVGPYPRQGRKHRWISPSLYYFKLTKTNTILLQVLTKQIAKEINLEGKNCFTFACSWDYVWSGQKYFDIIFIVTSVSSSFSIYAVLNISQCSQHRSINFSDLHVLFPILIMSVFT